MDRSYERIRAEVLELDLESQRKLADEIEVHLAESQTELDQAWDEEIRRRMEAHRRGEGTYSTREEMMARAEKRISDWERKHR